MYLNIALNISLEINLNFSQYISIHLLCAKQRFTMTSHVEASAHPQTSILLLCYYTYYWLQVKVGNFVFLPRCLLFSHQVHHPRADCVSLIIQLLIWHNFQCCHRHHQPDHDYHGCQAHKDDDDNSQECPPTEASRQPTSRWKPRNPTFAEAPPIQSYNRHDDRNDHDDHDDHHDHNEGGGW